MNQESESSRQDLKTRLKNKVVYDDFITEEIKKGEGQGRNVTLETMMHSKLVKL
jgi:hypothetical protein